MFISRSIQAEVGFPRVEAEAGISGRQLEARICIGRTLKSFPAASSRFTVSRQRQHQDGVTSHTTHEVQRAHGTLKTLDARDPAYSWDSGVQFHSEY